MLATILPLLGAIIIGLGLIASFIPYATKRRPVTFKNSDEQNAVYDVACWAAKQLNIKVGHPRLRYSLLIGASWGLIGRAPIPAEELAVLAPFIDLVIDGKGPPLNLPAEYEDWRPETLAAFKKRMQAEGLWPPRQS